MNQELKTQMAQFAKDQRDMVEEFANLMVNALKVSRMALEEVSKPLVMLGEIADKTSYTIKRLDTATSTGKRRGQRAALESLKRDNMYGK